MSDGPNIVASPRITPGQAIPPQSSIHRLKPEEIEKEKKKEYGESWSDKLTAALSNFWPSMFQAFAAEGRDWAFYGGAILLVIIGLWAVLK